METRQNSRTFFHNYAIGITPAMTKPAVGQGSVRAVAALDSGKAYMDGSYTVWFGPKRRKAKKATGFKPCQTKVSTSSCAYTDHWSRGSKRLGNRAISNRLTNTIYDVWGAGSTAYTSNILLER